MRVGDFSLEVVAGDSGAREIDSGHVLTRPGQVYTLRLRNHGPLRAVVDISIDGRRVTGGGLVLNASSTVDLERPIHESERGRFTVVAEGNEQVFGPDGGRDNPDLGLIEARFRRELPSFERREIPQSPSVPNPRPIVINPRFDRPADPANPGHPRRWVDNQLGGSSGGGLRGRLDGSEGMDELRERLQREMRGAQSLREESITALFAAAQPTPEVAPPSPAYPAEAPGIGEARDTIERAAGTGLTGSSAQDFVPVHVGPLETEATVIRLRLVIGTEEALSAPRPLPESIPAPARPAPRP